MSEQTQDDAFDAEYDLVVVGGGAAGKSAALTAAQAGLSVVILEKMPQTGGTSIFAEGTAAFESSEQKARGVPKDAGKHFPTKGEAFRRYHEYSHFRCNPDVVRMFVENAWETIDLYRSLGIEYTDVTIYAYDQPNELYTFHRPEGLGARCQEVLLAAVEKAGVDIFTSTRARRLITSEGAVVGVVAEDGDGNEIRVGGKAVVLASGGFGNNLDLVAKYSWYPLTAREMDQPVPTQNVGDGLAMALEVGADTESIGAMLIAAGARGKALGSHSGAAGFQPGLWVNLTGKRFVNEEIALAVGDAGNVFGKQPHAVVFSLIDEATIERLVADGSEVGQGDFIRFGQKLTRLRTELDQDVADGIAWKSDTVEGLAARIGVDPAVLAVTVAEYNASCDSGDDPLFFKGAKYLRPLRQGPFYAINMTSSALASTGGIRVNGNLQVVDQDYQPIPGLYAAGHDASGLYGDTYNMDVPGTANGFAHTSGRVAARHVVATLQNAPAAH